MEKVSNVIFKIFLLSLCLIGCDKYSNNYSAASHFYSNDSTSACMSFSEFEGTEVFKFFVSENANPMRIYYSGHLETGSMNVYYDFGETKKELFTINSGENISSFSEPFDSETIYIIVEANQECKNGNFNFSLSEDPVDTGTFKLNIVDSGNYIYDKPPVGTCYIPGITIALHSYPIMDADLVLYVKGEFYSKQTSIETDEGYVWEYTFITLAEEATLEFKVEGGI